ncbi:site-specific integrase [Desulfuromonas sp. KJ2020]|uniref:tyrosine-type recombinase/integrase n=1 Tax=Desulfuromonas sp. KJ2020 TaxID=2919173 RepID=UPI0020A73B79|nr:site-specific integrase [Desulfuromonas sp. KJ2020]MCP3176333.1 site-specific integrase [Desulfuromonas sp. KJ2020]
MAVIQERKTSSGKIKYRVLIRLRGCPPQSATFDRKTDAKKWAQDTESAIRDGRFFKTIEAKKHTFSEMVNRYVKQVLPLKPKMQSQQKSQLEWWENKLGHYLLSDVTPAMIGECRDQLLNEETSRGARRSPATTNRYLAALSHCYTMALNEWGWVELNPVSRVKKPVEPRGRVRFLSDDERIGLLEACEKSYLPSLHPIVVLALSTGMRQGEILRLKWCDIDFERRQLVIHETKNGERRVVPVVSQAYGLLREYGRVRPIGSEYVFPAGARSGIQAIRKAWEAALKKAGIKDFRFHDLRHSAASYLAMNGATLAEIAEVLGHKTLSMVKRYSHLSEAHTAGVVERMNERIFSNV